jgi:TonB family protein
VNNTTRLFTISICAFLLLHGSSTSHAQDAPPVSNPTQLTAEQKASLDEAVQLARKVQQLNTERRFDQALPMAQRVVELRRRVLGENDALVADALTNVGEIYIGKDDYERAEAQFRKALSIYEKASPGSGNVAYVLDALALFRWSAGDYNKAEDFGNRALTLRAEVYGEQSVQFFNSVETLLKIYDSAGKTSQRNALYARVLSIVEKTKDRIPDRLALFRYHCGLRKGKQTAEVAAMLRQIEALLAWNPSGQTPVTEGVLNGRALVLVRPNYPDDARARRAQGQVVVEIEIDECGRVISAKAVSGDASLRAVSETAAKAASFTPTYVDGTPIRVKGILQYNFVNQGP